MNLHQMYNTSFDWFSMDLIGKLFDLGIYIVKLNYTDTTPPFEMEIRIVYTECV